MARMQRYVSDELTHFVGRQSTSTDDEKYGLLLKILRLGWLTHFPHDESDTTKRLNVEFANKFSQNTLINTGVICFCDIPLEDLDIHIGKYSKFGMALSKNLMITKGANPVFYIASNSQIRLGVPLIEHSGDPRVEVDASNPPSKKEVTRAEYFDESIIEVLQYLALFDILLQKGKFDLEPRLISALREYIRDTPLTAIEEQAFSAALGILVKREGIPLNTRMYGIREFLGLHLLSFIKFFDASKTEDDPDNYYMEREWRVLGNVQFRIEDVRRIIIPEVYAIRLRTDLPDYYGQITFSG